MWYAYLHAIISASIITAYLGARAENPSESRKSGSRKLPLGVQDIRKILGEGYAYVDKTGFALQLIEGGSHSIISRPKGFGKTLLISTLDEILKGNKELFRGTEIYRSNYNWPKYSVFRIDFSQLDSTNSSTFDRALEAELKKFAEPYGVDTNKAQHPGEFIDLLYEVSMKTGMEIAVLVDAYDAPITNNIQNANNLRALSVAEDHRQMIAYFLKYATNRVENLNVRFVFVVGVNKYKWEGGNVIHVENADMDPKYATMLGFTEEEVRNTFGFRIRDIARRNNVSEEDILDEMRLWYNGYRFTTKDVTVYNPQSTLHYLSKRKAGNYWYNYRNYSKLIDAAARDNMPLGLQDTTVGLRLRQDDFNISCLRYIDVRPLMYYAGYLTIRKHHPERNWFDLDFPNKEARDAYNTTYLRRDRFKDHHGQVKD